jgi:hypothetical protein
MYSEIKTINVVAPSGKKFEIDLDTTHDVIVIHEQIDDKSKLSYPWGHLMSFHAVKYQVQRIRVGRIDSIAKATGISEKAAEAVMTLFEAQA